MRAAPGGVLNASSGPTLESETTSGQPERVEGQTDIGKEKPHAENIE